MKRQRIMAVVDRSLSQPEPALQRAIFLAKEMNAALELFSVAQGSSSNEGIREEMAWVEGLAERLSEEGLILAADAVWSWHQASAVIEKATVTRPQILIMTAHDNSDLGQNLFNYTEWHLIRHCPCPLLLAKSKQDWTTRRILACVDPVHAHADTKTLACATIELAQSLADRVGGELHVLHSVNLLPGSLSLLAGAFSSHAEYNASVLDEREAMLSKLLAPYGIGQGVHLVRGRPARAIASFAREMDTSLVVMGAVWKGALKALFIVNTAEKLLDTLSCHVLVVKSDPIPAKVMELASCAA